jgi:hypothetical protein
LKLDELVAEAELGDEAKSFLEGNLGKFLKGVADQEIRIVQDLLLKADPENTIAIRELQNRAFRWQMFVELLEGLVNTGNQAIEIFKQQTEQES